MESFVIILMMIFSVNHACPDNCFCTESTLECIIDSCDLGFLDDYPVMILHGTLCEEHRVALRNGDSQIVLVDDTCNDLLNCR